MYVTSLFNMKGLLTPLTLKNSKTSNATIVISLATSKTNVHCLTKGKRGILKDLNLECLILFNHLAKILLLAVKE
jgi:hypothetical protein